jgi:hypothetical protein
MYCLAKLVEILANLWQKIPILDPLTVSNIIISFITILITMVLVFITSVDAFLHADIHH